MALSGSENTSGTHTTLEFIDLLMSRNALAPNESIVSESETVVPSSTEQVSSSGVSPTSEMTIVDSVGGGDGNPTTTSSGSGGNSDASVGSVNATMTEGGMVSSSGNSSSSGGSESTTTAVSSSSASSSDQLVAESSVAESSSARAATSDGSSAMVVVGSMAIQEASSTTTAAAASVAVVTTAPTLDGVISRADNTTKGNDTATAAVTTTNGDSKIETATHAVIDPKIELTATNAHIAKNDKLHNESADTQTIANHAELEVDYETIKQRPVVDDAPSTTDSVNDSNNESARDRGTDTHPRTERRLAKRKSADNRNDDEHEDDGGDYKMIEFTISEAPPIVERRGVKRSLSADDEAETTSDIVSHSNAISQNAAAAKKKKSTTQTITLLQFVSMLGQAMSEARIEQRRVIFSRPIADYVNKFDDSRITRFPEKGLFVIEKNDHRQLATLQVLLSALSSVENLGTIFQFSKEALKYFLATHTRFVVPGDFADTNSLGKNEKRNKNSSPLPPGGILIEYSKGLDAFGSNMSRADKDDLLALRCIIENRIEISPTIYAVCRTPFDDARYEVDTESTHRDGYLRIPTQNFKRATLLITRAILMIYDGSQFVLPPVSVERDIQNAMVAKFNLAWDEYLLLDMLLSTRNKVLDVIHARVGGMQIPHNYRDRLCWMIKRFPDLKCIGTINGSGNQVTLNESFTGDSSYIQKKLQGYGVSYIYNKPNPTVAVVGTFEKSAYVAYRQDDRTLVVKSRANISGPTMYLIATEPYRSTQQRSNSSSNSQAASSSDVFIMHENRQHRLVGDLDKVSVFAHTVSVELKDGTKLGNVSNHPVSSVSEYKPPAAPKDSAMNDSFSIHMQNPEKLIEMIAKCANYQKILQGLMNHRHASIDVSFGNYD